VQVARTYFIVRVSLSQHSQRGMLWAKHGPTANRFKLESGRFADTLSVYQWSQPLPVCQEPIQCLARSSWVQYRVRGA
jgi:uncharacterized protein YqcC (DUF446 family)